MITWTEIPVVGFEAYLICKSDLKSDFDGEVTKPKGSPVFHAWFCTGATAKAGHDFNHLLNAQAWVENQEAALTK